MPDGTKQIDEATTLALIRAFKQASDDQNAARNAVLGTASNLASGWTGVASGAYGDGISRWLSGLQKVHQALQLIDDAMGRFSVETDSTEDDNLLAAMRMNNASWT